MENKVLIIIDYEDGQENCDYILVGRENAPKLENIISKASKDFYAGNKGGHDNVVEAVFGAINQEAYFENLHLYRIIKV